MKNLIKLLSFVFVLSLTVAACSDKKDCKEDCKKENCEKKDCENKADCDKKKCDKEGKECTGADKAECTGEDCKEACCSKEAKTCEPGCEKPCCASEADSANVDGPVIIDEDQQAHTCGAECKSDPESCPHHTH